MTALRDSIVAAALAAAVPFVFWANVRGQCEAGVVSSTPACAAAGDPASARARLASAPGDAFAWVTLALAPSPQSGGAPLDSASALAPQDATLLLARSAGAIRAGDWATAGAALTRLADHNPDLRAPRLLAQMAVAGYGRYLIPHIKPGGRWLPPTLNELRKIPGGPQASAALLVRAISARAVDPSLADNFVSILRGEGDWVDAYGLWLAARGGSAPLLYDSDFNRPLNDGDFGWQARSATGQPGAVIERTGSQRTGRELKLRFTGRGLTGPVLWQHVVAGPGRFRLEGDFRVDNLRLQSGLAWFVTCPASPGFSELSSALVAAEPGWTHFSFTFDVPPPCGEASRIDLRPLSEVEAKTGGTGSFALRRLSMTRAAR